MKRFLFITHMTPREKRSGLRQELINLYYKALENQVYPNWRVLILGEDDKQEGRFDYISLPLSDRATQLENIRAIYAGGRFQQIAADADYIIKLDDDDLVSPTLLSTAADKDFDLYYDEYHTFYDCSSGIITQQKRDWVASTCIHRKSCILSRWEGPGASAVGNLLYTDHSKTWHVYYKDKHKLAAAKNAPVYLRVLSPTSISSGAQHTGGVLRFEDIAMSRYMDYLRSFGNWQRAAVHDFDAYLPALAQAWTAFSGQAQQPLPPMTAPGWKNLLRKLAGRKS